MFSKFPLIAPEECESILEEVKLMNWESGHTPSPEYASKVKKNHEIPMGVIPDADEHMKWIVQMLMDCTFFTKRTLPKHMTRPRFNRYRDNGEYRPHADSAFMGNNPEVRTDISLTLFLTDPDTYDGGELVLEYATGLVVPLKEPAGTLVFYPSGVTHRVNPVTRGERISFVAWVESHVQDAHKRELLFEMDTLCDEVGAMDAHNPTHTRLLGVKHNLFRLWMGKT